MVIVGAGRCIVGRSAELFSEADATVTISSRKEVELDELKSKHNMNGNQDAY